LKEEYKINIRWRAFPLRPETPEEGILIKDLFSHYSSEELKSMQARLKKAAESEGLPFGEREKTFNSRLAQELGKWAESRNKGDQFHHAVFEAFLVDGINIAAIPALLNIASSIGLPRDVAEEVLMKRSFKSLVDKDWALSSEKLITAAPSFVMNNEKLVGAQPYEMIERFVQANGAVRRGDQLRGE